MVSLPDSRSAETPPSQYLNEIEVLEERQEECDVLISHFIRLRDTTVVPLESFLQSSIDLGGSMSEVETRTTGLALTSDNFWSVYPENIVTGITLVEEARNTAHRLSSWLESGHPDLHQELHGSIELILEGLEGLESKLRKSQAMLVAKMTVIEKRRVKYGTTIGTPPAAPAFRKAAELMGISSSASATA